jgi:hypothetical protein
MNRKLFKYRSVSARIRSGLAEGAINLLVLRRRRHVRSHATPFQVAAMGLKG